jgi:hypothetical protein
VQAEAFLSEGARRALRDGEDPLVPRHTARAESRGLSPEALGTICGLTALRFRFSNDPPAIHVGTLVRFARALKIPTADLLKHVT